MPVGGTVSFTLDSFMQFAQCLILKFVSESVYEYQISCFWFDTELCFVGCTIAVMGANFGFGFDVYQSARQFENVSP